MAFAATWMDGQTVRHQNHMLSLTCGILKMDTMNFFAEQILTHRLKNLWFPNETGQEVGGWAGGLGWKCYKIGL